MNSFDSHTKYSSREYQSSQPVPVFPDARVNRKCQRMVQKSQGQFCLRSRLISGLVCTMKESTHELLGVTNIEGRPRVMCDCEMLLVSVIV